MSRLKTRYKEVEYVLENSLQARDSDTFLTNAIWVKFYNHLLRQMENGDWVLPLKYNGDIASRDDIKRARARIQNTEKRYLPTSWAVAKKRHWKEAEYYDFYRRENPSCG